MTTGVQRTWTRFTPSEHEGLIYRAQDGHQQVIPADDLIRACDASQLAFDLAHQIYDLMEKTGEWLNNHRDRVDRGYLARMSDGSSVFVVVRRETRFDPEIEDALADFDLRIYQDDALQGLKYRSLMLPQCPDDAVGAMVDLSKAFVARMSN